MVNHYRWDFIGLSTDQKPTPETSEKVVDGSTYYCSDNSKLYVFYKDQWYERTATGGGGGGTTYTAGNGIDITGDTISIDDEVVATLAELDARIAKGEGAPTTATEGVVGGLYEDNTNGKLYICTAITEGTDPDPDTYTWEEVGGGGGGDTVYSTVTTSNSNTGGAVYIGNLNASQEEQVDPTSTDEHSKYFWALPGQNNSVPGYYSVNILGNNSYNYCVAIGKDTNIPSIGQYGTAIGYGATVRSQYGVSLGSSAYIDDDHPHSVALGDRAQPTRAGEVNVGQSIGQGYNNTNYRVIGGVHDGQNNHDCATVAQGNTLSTSAPTTSTEGVLGQLWTDTTNMHTYQCTAISGDTYTWTQRW